MPVARINNHNMYYEVHGASGPPVILMGGWGTFCHGGEGFLPRGLTDKYRVVLIDYRGICDSDDELDKTPSIDMYADDAIQLLDHLKMTNVHLIGLVGMGACICQLMAIKRPELARSMINMGAWADAKDPFFRDQMEMFGVIHRDAGWLAFQQHVCVMSFRPDYYNANRHKLIGPQGPWKELRDKYPVHKRFLEACLAYDVTGELNRIKCPSLVIHSGQDIVTSPRLTKVIEDGIPGATGLLLPEFAHVVAGKEEKIQFAAIVHGWLDKN